VHKSLIGGGLYSPYEGGKAGVSAGPQSQYDGGKTGMSAGPQSQYDGGKTGMSAGPQSQYDGGKTGMSAGPQPTQPAQGIHCYNIIMPIQLVCLCHFTCPCVNDLFHFTSAVLPCLKLHSVLC
jgi:hypothetical protein